MSIRSVLAPKLRSSALFVLALAGLGAGALPSAAVAPHRSELARVTGIDLVGHGDGPGIGMGQWGAFGDAVRYHFGYERILNHFYGGTLPANLAQLDGTADPTIRVAVLENVDLMTNVGYDPVVTSSSPFTVSAAPGVSTPVATTTSTTAPSTATIAPTSAPITSVAAAPPAASTAGVSSPGANFVVPAGSAVDFRLQANGTWSAYEAASCAAVEALPLTAPLATDLINPMASPATASATALPAQLLTLCRHDGVDERLRGSIEAVDRLGYARTVNLVPLQSYLDGVVPAEVSPVWALDGGTVGAPQGAAWGFQALEAQAVASRSYALAAAASGGWNGYADICDTATCQSYVGADFESASTDAAVAATAGEVRVTTTGPAVGLAAVASTRFSASTGGWTAPGIFPAVRDPGDACVVVGLPAECNPDHSWKLHVPVGVLDRQFRVVGRLQRLHVSVRNAYGALGGRAVSVRISGSKTTITVSGAAFAAAAGLPSDWFAIAHLDRAGAARDGSNPTEVGSTTTIP